jgi:NAD(P)-dependent dehydrogenase (short-subunit alcohol dehydrogenase family)
MAVDYAKDRIHVNCLCPGFVQSPMIASITADPDARAGLEAQHPWNALGRPEDIADAALFLSSDEALVFFLVQVITL